MPDPYIQHAAWLVAELKKRRLSVREVARRADVAPTTISRLLRQKIPLSLHVAIQLSRILGITLDKLLRRTGVTVIR